MPPGCFSLRRLIRQGVERNPTGYRDLRADLIAANMGMTLEKYLLRAFLASGLFGIICSVSGYLVMRLIPPPEVRISVHNVFNLQMPEFVMTDASVAAFRVAASAVIFLLAVYGGYIFFLRYPSIRKKNRETRINLVLHSVVSYMYAMRRGGAQMVPIFRAISTSASVYGEAAYEFRRVVRDTDYFGYDQITALRHLQETTPSEKLAEFVQDLVSVVESGGDVLAFLDTRVRVYQETGAMCSRFLIPGCGSIRKTPGSNKRRFFPRYNWQPKHT